MAVQYTHNSYTLNKDVTILKEYQKQSSFGAPEYFWHPVAQVRASIEPLNGREYWIASQSQGEASVRIVIRYRDGVTNRTRLLYKSRDGDVVYELKSPPINKLEANQWLELMCKELSNESST